MQTVFTFSLFTKYTALFFRTHGQSVRICKNSFHVYWISCFSRYRPSICQEQWLTKFDKRTMAHLLEISSWPSPPLSEKKIHHHHKNLQLPPNVLADDQLLVEVTASKNLINNHYGNKLSPRHLSTNAEMKSFTSSGKHIFFHFSAFEKRALENLDSGHWWVFKNVKNAFAWKDEQESCFFITAVWSVWVSRDGNGLPLILDSWACNLEWSISWIRNHAGETISSQVYSTW